MWTEMECGSGGMNESGTFPSTYWPSIELAGEVESEAGQAALSEVLRKYWRPMEVFVSMRFSAFLAREKVDAGDLVQEFIACRVLEGPFFQTADRKRGSKFRSFLKASLSNFVLEKIRRAQATKRAALKSAVSLELMSSEDELDKAAQASASTAMDREWARLLFERCVDRMQHYCEQRRRSDYWRLFELRFLEPYLNGKEPVTYDEIVSILGFRSNKAAADAMREVRTTWRSIVRKEIAEYAVESQRIEEEVSELIEVLTG